MQRELAFVSFLEATGASFRAHENAKVRLVPEKCSMPGAEEIVLQRLMFFAQRRVLQQFEVGAVVFHASRCGISGHEYGSERVFRAAREVEIMYRINRDFSRKKCSITSSGKALWKQGAQSPYAC